MPWSTAACERGFSAMNRIKTSHRSCLQHDTVNDLLHVSVSGPPLRAFSPDKALELWWTTAQRRRHVHGHKTPKRQNTVTEAAVVHVIDSSESDSESEKSDAYNMTSDHELSGISD